MRQLAIAVSATAACTTLILVGWNLVKPSTSHGRAGESGGENKPAVIDWEKQPDYEGIVARFGIPDRDTFSMLICTRDKGDKDDSIPAAAWCGQPTASRLVTYTREHVRFMFLTGEKLGAKPPYHWRLFGVSDSRAPANRLSSWLRLSADLALKRLAGRDRLR
jgi:hypothetical protein